MIILAKEVTSLIDPEDSKMGGTTPASSKKRRASVESSGSSSSSSESDGGDSSSDESDVPVKMKPARPPSVSAEMLRESLILDPPSFSLGDSSEDGTTTEFDSDRYEIWSFRMPVSISIQDLDGCEIMVPDTKTASVRGGIVAAPAGNNGAATKSDHPVSIPTKNGGTCTLRWGHKVENESFRVLMERKEDDSDDESDELAASKSKKKKFLSPVNAAFQRHINVVSALEVVPETKLAPGTSTAPVPDLVTRGVQHQMRQAYKHVPQKTGLKRRWMPLGSKGGAEIVQQESRPRSLSASSILLETHKKRKRSLSGQNGSLDCHPPPVVSSSNGLSTVAAEQVGTLSGDDKSHQETKAERKARKAAKKAAKKAKKEKKVKKEM